MTEYGASQLANQDARTTLTDDADDLLAAAPGVGQQLFITGYYATNGHATVHTKIALKRDTTVVMQFFAAALGGGFGFEFDGIPWGEGVALNVANITDASDTDVLVTYRVGPVRPS